MESDAGDYQVAHTTNMEIRPPNLQPQKRMLAFRLSEPTAIRCLKNIMMELADEELTQNSREDNMDREDEQEFFLDMEDLADWLEHRESNAWLSEHDFVCSKFPNRDTVVQVLNKYSADTN